MNLNFLRRQAIISSQARKRNLPYLCEVEYLESTGEQWITIPYQILTTDTFRHETANQYTKFDSNQYEGQTSAGNWYGINGSGKYTIGSGIVSSFTASTNEFDSIIAESNETGLTLTVNGNIVGTRYAKSGGTKVCLFDCYNPNAAATGNYYNFVRKKYHKLYVNGSLFFDGIPVLDYLLRPAMFDRVSGKFFYNEGTGADFKYGLRGADGNLYTPVPYIESTGEQWIKLNMPLGTTENIKHETSIMVMQVGTKQQEGYATPTRWYRITEDGHYTIGDANSSILASTTNYDNVVLETINKKATLIVNGEVILTRSSFVNASPDTFLFIANEKQENPCYIRKKYHRFYVNNKLKFAGIPVINASGKPAMFDIVTKKPFYNNGTGADFIVGE